MKVAYVTGASRGLGRRIAELLAPEYELALGSQRTPITGFERALHLQGDVADAAAATRAAEEIERRFGGLDLFVANAGIEISKPFTGVDEDDWDRSIAVNLNGVFFGLRSLATLLRRSKGSVVIIGSLLGKRGANGSAPYAASKAALFGLARTAAREFAPDVRVNIILPGYLDTEMGRSAPAAMERAKREHLLGELGSIEDAARMALFLANSPGISGQAFAPDGRLSSW